MLLNILMETVTLFSRFFDNRKFKEQYLFAVLLLHHFRLISVKYELLLTF